MGPDSVSCFPDFVTNVVGYFCVLFLMEIPWDFFSVQLLVPCPISYLTYGLILIRLNRCVKDFKNIGFHELCVMWGPSKEEIRAACIFTLLEKGRREKWWKRKEY